MPTSRAVTVVGLVLGLSLAPAAANAAEAASSEAGAYFRDCEACPELVRVPPGSFLMGSVPEETERAQLPEARARAEHGVVRVEIPYAFAIGRYELTIAEFAVFAEETGFESQGGCFEMLASKAWQLNAEASWRDPGYAVTDRHPAACLNSREYQLYLDWLSQKTGQRYRMPSEAEWEYAARLGSEEVRIWQPEDADACRHLNGADAQFRQAFTDDWLTFACDDGYPITAPVGTYAPNGIGMYDVFGNTAEVTLDCFVNGHAGAPTDGSPRAAEPCPVLVYKGGSWAAEPGFMRPAFRVAATPDVHGNGWGLRVVRELD